MLIFTPVQPISAECKQILLYVSSAPADVTDFTQITDGRLREKYIDKEECKECENVMEKDGRHAERERRGRGRRKLTPSSAEK